MEEKIIKKNKIYSATGDEDYGCIFIAAKNGKEAKKIAMKSWVAETVENPYIDLKVTRCWSVKEIDFEGELDIYQINQLGLTWWECPECGNEEFEILDNYHYLCKNCREENKIPYVNY